MDVLGTQPGKRLGECRTGDGRGAEAFQVVGGHLAVDQLATALLQGSDQADEAGFRGIAPAAEHGLAEEHPTQGNAIESAHQLVAFPDLHRVRDIALM